MQQNINGNKPKWFSLGGEGAGSGEVKLAFEFLPKPPAELRSESSIGHVVANKHEREPTVHLEEPKLSKNQHQALGMKANFHLKSRLTSVELCDESGVKLEMSRKIVVGLPTSTQLVATSRGQYGQATTRFGSLQIKGQPIAFKLQAQKFPLCSVKTPLFASYFPKIGHLSAVKWEFQFASSELHDSISTAIHTVEVEHWVPCGHRSLYVNGKQIIKQSHASWNKTALNILWDMGR